MRPGVLKKKTEGASRRVYLYLFLYIEHIHFNANADVHVFVDGRYCAPAQRTLPVSEQEWNWQGHDAWGDELTQTFKNREGQSEIMSYLVSYSK